MEKAENRGAVSGDRLRMDPLRLENTFFVSNEKITRFENRMATGYDVIGLAIPG